MASPLAMEAWLAKLRLSYSLLPDLGTIFVTHTCHHPRLSSAVTHLPIPPPHPTPPPSSAPALLASLLLARGAQMKIPRLLLEPAFSY